MLRTPAFVERMDLPDDAEGRVAIFSVDGDPQAVASETTPRRTGGLREIGHLVATALDSRYIAAVFAMVLVALLVLGLLLRR